MGGRGAMIRLLSERENSFQRGRTSRLSLPLLFALLPVAPPRGGLRGLTRPADAAGGSSLRPSAEAVRTGTIGERLRLLALSAGCLILSVGGGARCA